MTGDKKPHQRKKVPTPQELDDKQEDWTGQSVASGKGKPTSSKANRNPMRLRKGVGRKKMDTDPRKKPKPKPASKPDKAETTAKPATGSSSRTLTPQLRTASEPPKPSTKQSKEKYARAMALYEAEKQGHQMGPFKEWPNDGGRDRAYESKCSICDRRAIALVQYLEGYTDAMGEPRWHGDATKGSCSTEPRRKPVAKNEPTAQPRSKSGKQEKLPASFEVPIPSWDGILEATARDTAHRAANNRDRGHQVKAMVRIAYPEAGKDSLYQGTCEKCRRKVFGKVQRFPGEPGKSERILVYGDALQYPCSGARAKR